MTLVFQGNTTKPFLLSSPTKFLGSQFWRQGEGSGSLLFLYVPLGLGERTDGGKVYLLTLWGDLCYAQRLSDSEGLGGGKIEVSGSLCLPHSFLRFHADVTSC